MNHEKLDPHVLNATPRQSLIFRKELLQATHWTPHITTHIASQALCHNFTSSDR